MATVTLNITDKGDKIELEMETTDRPEKPEDMTPAQKAGILFVEFLQQMEENEKEKTAGTVH